MRIRLTLIAASIFLSLSSLLLASVEPTAEVGRETVWPRAEQRAGDVVLMEWNTFVDSTRTDHGKKSSAKSTTTQKFRREALEAVEGKLDSARVSYEKGGTTVTDELGKTETPSSLAGGTFVLKRMPDGTVAADPKADFDEALKLAVAMRTDIGLLPPRAVGVGDSWAIDVAKLVEGAMGSLPEFAGTGKLAAIKTVGGRKVAVIHVSIDDSATVSGISFKLRLSGSAELDVATGQSVAGRLTGVSSSVILGAGASAEGKLEITWKGRVVKTGQAPGGGKDQAK